MVANFSRAGLRRIGSYSGVALDGRSVVGVYPVWKKHDIPLADAIERTRYLGFDVSLTSLYDDAVADGWDPGVIRNVIVGAVRTVDGPELATAMLGLLLIAEKMKCPALEHGRN